MAIDPDDTVFEDEARRIARELWPFAQYDIPKGSESIEN